MRSDVNVVLHKSKICLQRFSLCQFIHSFQNIRRHISAFDLLFLQLTKRLLDRRFNDARIRLGVFRKRNADNSAARCLERFLRANERSDGVDARDRKRRVASRRAREEGGEDVGLESQNGDALSLQHFERALDVEDGLDAGAEDGDGRAAELRQIGGDVHRDFAAAVDAADASRCHDLDADHVGDQNRARDGRRAVFLFGDDVGQIAARALVAGFSVFSKELELLVGEADVDSACDDGDRGGNRAVSTDDVLEVAGALDVLGIRHSVGDDGRFERDDFASAVGKGELLSDFI